jgi:hypothetical protein
MATSTSITNADPVLKRIYSDTYMGRLVMQRRPLLGMLPKFEGFGGSTIQVVFEYGNPQGRSAAFATAQTNASQVRLGALQLSRVSQYMVATIDGEAIEATRDNKVAFLSMLKAKIDGAVNALSNALETQLFRSGTGAIGTVGAESTTSLTLAQPEEVSNYEVGMVLKFYAADETTVRAGTAAITGINRSTGVLTSGSNWATTQITDLVATDVIYNSGDQAGSTTALTCIAGLQAWLPSSAPGSGSSFFGLDRSTDSRLYGYYKDESSAGKSMEEIYIDAVSAVARDEGAPNVILHHHAQHRKLVKDLGSKRIYADDLSPQTAKGPTAGWGYKALMLEGGPDAEGLKVVAASRCPATNAFLLRPEVWKLNSLGPVVKVLDDDGVRMLRAAAADSYESRWVFRGNLSCRSPRDNARILLPSP